MGRSSGDFHKERLELYDTSSSFSGLRLGQRRGSLCAAEILACGAAAGTAQVTS
jgi:hypothetical protein